MNRKVRVAIIGAGSAGLSAVKEVRKETDDFLLIESGSYGTSCARVACMPSKALIEIANAYHRRMLFGTMGIHGGDSLRVDTAAVLARVRSLRDRFVANVVQSTEALGERNLKGHARFLDPTHLQVGEDRIAAESVIIATGSRPIIPEPWQAIRDRVSTSDEIFDWEKLPETVAVVGMGAVGLELAQAMARLECRVTAFEAGGSVGGLTDDRVNEALIEYVSGEFTLRLDASPVPARADSGIRLLTDQQEVMVDRVLLAVGRRPNLDGLGIENLGLDVDAQGVPQLDPETLRLGDLPVFLAGDANGFRPFLHEAADDGRIAGYGAVHEDDVCFTRRVPLSIAFSEPNAVRIGESFQGSAARHGVVGEVNFSAQGRARMAGLDHGILRLYAAADDGRVLGAEMAAPAAEHLAHLLAAAIAHGATVWTLLQTPFYHPVYEEGLRSALQDAARQLKGPSGTELLLCGAAPEASLC